MSDPKPKLADLRRRAPGELAQCEGYVWHLKSRIGKGSFGEVYLGWNTAGTGEVAVKVVKKEFFKQDPKVRENLEREIRIMKLLRGCDYVVRLLHVQELKATIVMVMELCEYDLDHLVKVQPFTEEDTTLLLFELAQGMKALREQNIVHRDLKPGNILIRKHPITGKMMIKLADFGFARHFKDEGMKPIDMTSLAGTPVFMAPEALRCVFHPGEHYDDKVDIWSIGALLYKVIVGSCGFYAQLQDIPRILKHKGEAIAFERVPHSRKITYINELPASVNDRMSEPYREKMNGLLRSMLKIDPTERMTFTDFFEFVDDIITSKVEVINLLHGTTLKVILDPKMTSEQLMQAIEAEFQVPSKAQVIFSNASPLFLSPDRALSHQQFSELLNVAGGSRGHAVLYVLPINHVVQDRVVADQRCFTLLKYVIDDATLVDLVLEHKFSDEIVHAIAQLQAQQRRQLSGLEEFCKFTTTEVARFSSQSFRQLWEQGHRALAKVEVVAQWLREDMATLGSANQLPALLQAMEGQKGDIEVCVRELQSFNGLLQLTVDGELTEDSIKAAGTLQDEAKRLGKMRRDHIQASCKGILEDCHKITQEASTKILKELQRLYNNLAQVWSLAQKSVVLTDRCYTLDQLFSHISQERAVTMRSISASASGVVKDGRTRSTPSTPPVVVTPVGGVAPTCPNWSTAATPQANFYPGAPPPVVGWAGQQQQQQQPGGGTSEALKKENAKLKQECATLTLKVQELSERKRSRDSTGYDEELGTIRPGDLRARSPVDVESTMKPSNGGGGGGEMRMTPEDARILEKLGIQLQQFCLTAEKLKPGISGSPPEHRDKAQLYPSLLEDYSVISMPGDDKKPAAAAAPLPTDIPSLLPQAAQLSKLLQSNVSTLESVVKNSAMTPYSGLVKIAKPAQYEEGDVVLFHPTRMHRSKSTAPAMLHLDKPRPYIMMDFTSYSNFNIRPGRMPDMIVARLSEKPRSFRFEEDKDTAADLGESSGEFFRVKAEPTDLKFGTTRPSSRGPMRPPPPSATATTPTERSPGTGHHKNFFRKSHAKDKEFV